jgi:Tfp pilus assembly protein PilF
VADFKLAVGDSERASELIRTAIEIDPSNAGYHLTDARILLAQGRSSEAAAQANRALRLTKADADESSDLVMRIMSVIQSIEGESGG